MNMIANFLVTEVENTMVTSFQRLVLIHGKAEYTHKWAFLTSQKQCFLVSQSWI